MTGELEETVDVLRRLIGAASENPPGDERDVVQVVTELLEDRGLTDYTVIAREPHRPNLIAKLESDEPGPTLLLCGHVDTKPVGPTEKWDLDPFAGSISDGRLFGLGACDMKAGVASVIVALGRIRAAGGPSCGSVVGLFTADEEAGSSVGAKYLADSGHIPPADAAIIAEPAGVSREWERLYLGTRATLLFRVDLEGATGHSSLEDHVGGTSATLALARLIDRLDGAFRRLPGCAVNVGSTVEGGIHYAVRPGSAAFRGDVRFPPDVSYAQVRAVLEKEVDTFVADHPGVRATIITDELTDHAFEPLSVTPDSPIARACRTAAEHALGTAPPDGIYPAGTDSFFTQGIAGIPTMPALGPGRLLEAHQPNEFVSLESLEAGPAVLTEAAKLYLAEGPPMARATK